MDMQTTSVQLEPVEGPTPSLTPSRAGIGRASTSSARAEVERGGDVRTDLTRAEIAALFDLPFGSLVFRAAQVHRAHHAADEVQLCTLLSIKTGGCPED